MSVWAESLAPRYQQLSLFYSNKTGQLHLPLRRVWSTKGDRLAPKSVFRRLVAKTKLEGKGATRFNFLYEHLTVNNAKYCT